MPQAIGEDFARTVSLELFQLPCIWSGAKFLELAVCSLGVSMGLASSVQWSTSFTPMIFSRGCLTCTRVL